tara:strand:- start:121 stop:282 length:162 start_codon:yes stop_codon:yes gene_type:complete
MNTIISILKKIDISISNAGEKIILILESDTFGNVIITFTIIGLTFQIIRAFLQ